MKRYQKANFCFALIFSDNICIYIYIRISKYVFILIAIKSGAPRKNCQNRMKFYSYEYRIDLNKWL